MSRPAHIPPPAVRRSLNATQRARMAPWTPDFLAFVLDLAPDQVLEAGDGFLKGGCTPQSRLEWTWIQTAQRLAWTYGLAEAARRLNGYGHE